MQNRNGIGRLLPSYCIFHCQSRLRNIGELRRVRRKFLAFRWSTVFLVMDNLCLLGTVQRRPLCLVRPLAVHVQRDMQHKGMHHKND